MNPANKNNVWCRRWHLRAVHGTRTFRGGGGRKCVTCYRRHLATYCERRKAEVRARGLTGNRWLWEDDASEYRWMRDTLGMSPREIADKTGTRWESFQRTLHRRIGGKHEW